MSARLDALERELRAELAAVCSRLAALESRHGVRDAEEAAVLLAIAAAVGDRPFTGRQLLAHADVDPGLGDVLVEADVTTGRELGKLLARLSWQPIDGYRLVREGTSRDGILWRVQV